MKEVSKDEFERIYFQYGADPSSGWGRDYWEKFFATERKAGIRYWVEEPGSPAHTRMTIVADYATNEYRLFFMTEEDEDRMYEFPDVD